MSDVITALEVRPEDWDEYCVLRSRIAALVLKGIGPEWTSLHAREPELTFQGCLVLRGAE